MKTVRKKELYIVGAGSVGLHVAANFEAYSAGRYQLAGFFDDDVKKHGQIFFGIKVLGAVSEALAFKNASLAIGIAFPKIKKKIVSHLSQNSEIKFPALIHPRAWLSPDVVPEKGTIIYPGTSINYGSQIGEFCVFNMNCALGHHTKVGNFTSFAPGVLTGGHTTIDEGVDMGIGSATIQGVRIQEGAVVGGQALVREDIYANTVVAGIPAKVIRDI